VRRTVVSSDESDTVSVGSRVWADRAVDNVVVAKVPVSPGFEAEVELDESSDVDSVTEGDGVAERVAADVPLNMPVALVLPETRNWTL